MITEERRRYSEKLFGRGREKRKSKGISLSVEKFSFGTDGRQRILDALHRAPIYFPCPPSSKKFPFGSHLWITLGCAIIHHPSGQGKFVETMPDDLLHPFSARKHSPRLIDESKFTKPSRGRAEWEIRYYSIWKLLSLPKIVIFVTLKQWRVFVRSYDFD